MNTQTKRQNMFIRIRKLRKTNHITQEQMAKHIGISRRTYANYENGSHSMPVDVLVCVADYFDKSLDYLVGRTPEQDEE